MTQGIFIQANKKQLVGAKIARFAMETRGKAREHGIPVSIIEVEQYPVFAQLVGKPYRVGYAPFSFEDLQYFTLTRFMPPELMHFEGRSLVIDPDIFALTDIAPLMGMELGDAAIAACTKNPWDTSVMVLDNAKLTHWKIADIVSDIVSGKRSYETIAQLRDERMSIVPLSREWNSLDHLDADTKMLHTTKRLTQPWKTGLPIDFTFNPVPKLFGVIPRFWVQHPKTYQPHPDKNIQNLFFTLLTEALAAGAVTRHEIDEAIATQNIRGDIYEAMVL